LNNAASELDCHMEEGVDRKCFKKKITQDNCDCNHATCSRLSSVEEGLKFGFDDECPIGHVKKSGVSICEKARDICLQCPKPIRPRCSIGESVTKGSDANGCPKFSCQSPSIEATPAKCTCNEYKFNKLTNEFYCFCNEDQKAKANQKVAESLKMKKQVDAAAKAVEKATATATITAKATGTTATTEEEIVGLIDEFDDKYQIYQMARKLRQQSD